VLLLTQLRRRLKIQRNMLSAGQQRQAGWRFARRAQYYPPLRRAQRLAIYLAVRGELTLSPFIKLAWQRGQKLYLPVLHRRLPTLRFVAYSPQQVMRYNRFGIAEPAICRPQIMRNRLQAIIMPLLAFDAQGVRLGMGGGYYDRTLSNFRHRSQPRRIGVGYAFQALPHLPARAWDVPLHAALTDKRHYRFARYATHQAQ